MKYLAAFAVFAALGLTGCLNLKPATDPTRFFVLSSRIASSESTNAGWRASLGLAPIDIAPYLRRKEIAVVQGPNEVRYLDYYRWGEDLDQGVLNVLGLNLGSVLGTENIRLGTWHRRQVQYQLEVRLVHFEARTTGEVRLVASWRITSPGTPELLAAGEKTLLKPGPDPSVNPEGSVGAMSEALADLARALADALRQVDLQRSQTLPDSSGPKASN